MQYPRKFYIAKKEKSKEYSVFQLLDNSCIAGDISLEKPKSNVEIFSSKKLNVEEVIPIAKDFFNSPSLKVTTILKLAI